MGESSQTGAGRTAAKPPRQLDVEGVELDVNRRPRGRLLRLVGKVGAAVLHLRDLRVRVLRVGPVVVGTLLRPFPVQPGQLRLCRRRNARRGGQSVQEGLVAFTGVPPDDTPHRCVRFQRRCIDPDRLALDESGVGQPLQHPRENRFVRLEADPPPRARHRRVVRRGFVKRDVEERPQAQRIGGPPGNRPLGIEPLEVAQEQHPEVSARRQARPTHAVGVELRALLLGEGVEAGLVEHPIQAFVERVARAARQLAAGDPHRPLPPPGASFAHGHTPQCRARDRSCRSLNRGASPQAARSKL